MYSSALTATIDKKCGSFAFFLTFFFSLSFIDECLSTHRVPP